MSVNTKLEAIEACIKQMDEECNKLNKVQIEVKKQMADSTTGLATKPLSLEEKHKMDSRSVYVGNVDYGATPAELESHFQDCGAINRVTILHNTFDGHPKGFAYIEFDEKESVQTALTMNETLFRGRQIKVMYKRTNIPRLPTTNRFPRGGFPGRGAHTSRAFGHASTRVVRRSLSFYGVRNVPY